MHLIVDNTRPIDPTLPDLYDGIAANDDAPSVAFMLGGAAYRLWSVLPWVVVGLVAGLVIA